MNGKNIIFAILFCVNLLSCTAQTKNRQLTERILQDTSLQVVDRMARELIRRGFNAGSGYSQIWARDMNTFIETACDVSNKDELRQAILLFFALQQPNNEMIDGYVLKEDFTWHDDTPYYSDAAPTHVAFKNTVETDQESSLIQIVGKYIRKTNDRSILQEEVAGKTVLERMELMIDYLLKERYSEKYGLIYGAMTADWGDVQPYDDFGCDMNEHSYPAIDVYDNAMLIIALDYLLEMTEDKVLLRRWADLRSQLAENARKYLWDKERNKFVPHIYLDKSPIPEGFNELDVYYHGGTAVAIEAGLLTKEEIGAVNAQMLQNVFLSGMPSIGLTVYPPYPEGFFHGSMSKPYTYQNGGDWTWFGGRMIQQLIANGYVTEAYMEMRPMIDRVIKNQGFYEWYGMGDVPSGSGHFKGSAGVLAKAIDMLYQWCEENTVVETIRDSSSNQADENLSQYVEPRIGTAHCRWFHFAPGSMPFGMAKPGPSTNGHIGNKSGWEATGYDYRELSIEGFPCFHEFQIGGVVLMPTVGKLKTIPGAVNDATGEGYRSSFDRNEEVATAGYYSVVLKDYNIKVELTATPRVAFQRFTFPESKESHILFDIGNRQGESGAVKDAEVVLTEEGKIEGWVTTYPEYVKKYQPEATVTMYFSAELDKKPSGYGIFNGEKTQPGIQKATGIGAGLYLMYHTRKDESVTAKIGLSYTSIENARLNMRYEAASLNFEAAKTQAMQTWEEYLQRIRVETPVKEDKVKFYTGLYHALLGRGLASDVNGAYPRHNGSVGQIPLRNGKPVHNLYNTDAAWGIQWNLAQVWALAYPEYLSDYISSHLLVYKDSGWLGDGLANSRYVSGVGTNLLSAIIAGAYQCGIRDFDVELGYEASLKNEIDGENRPLGAGKVDTDLFVEYGYVPHIDEGEGPDEAFMFSASHTLEYSYSSWAVAQWAKSLGKTDDYNRLMYLSKGWERIYDPSVNFVRPKKKNGEFISNFDPMQVWRGFQEGNAWQYTFYVPHDVDKLVSKVGADVFNQRLDSIFTVSRELLFSGGTNVDAFAGLQTLYNHGNQPCLHISWLFNEAGRPHLTQKWVRAILDEFYGTDGIHGYGYGQDEDQGQLGAWYVISSLGLFDIKGLAEIEPSFSLGSPLFDKITIQLNRKYYKGDTFVIQTTNSSKETPFVKACSLNGKPLDTIRIPFQSVVSGGILEMTMGSQPFVF